MTLERISKILLISQTAINNLINNKPCKTNLMNRHISNRWDEDNKASFTQMVLGTNYKITIEKVGEDE